MIDLHCHILPSMDDGPDSLSESLRMAKIASADGITDIVATPHVENGLFHNSGRDILAAVQSLQSSLDQEQIPLTVHAGCEAHIHLELHKNLAKRHVLSINGHDKYILLELPSLYLPAFTDQLIKDLLSSGITPLIAHPERNEVLRKHPHRLAGWVERGVVAQLTAASLLGHMGKRTQAFSMSLLQAGLVHVLASDGHNATTRLPVLAEAYRMAEKIAGGDAVPLLVANARSILNGETCQAMKPFTGKRRHAFEWLRK